MTHHPAPFYERITALAKLPDGWQDGHGKTPTTQALTSASILGAALPPAVSPRVYPTGRGGVTLEWDDQHGQHVIEVLTDGHLTLSTTGGRGPA